MFASALLVMIARGYAGRLGTVDPEGRPRLAYRSVTAFGRVRVVDDRAQKIVFFDGLMYAIAIERMTGKETALPAAQSRWPAMDRTMSPLAQP